MISTKKYLVDNSNGYDVLYEVGEKIKITNIKGRTTEGMITRIFEDHFLIEEKVEGGVIHSGFTYDFVKAIKYIDDRRVEND